MGPRGQPFHFWDEGWVISEIYHANQPVTKIKFFIQAISHSFYREGRPGKKILRKLYHQPLPPLITNFKNRRPLKALWLTDCSRCLWTLFLFCFFEKNSWLHVTISLLWLVRYINIIRWLNANFRFAQYKLTLHSEFKIHWDLSKQKAQLPQKGKLLWSNKFQFILLCRARNDRFVWTL